MLIGARPELSVSQAREAGFKQAVEGFKGEVLIEHGSAFSRECGRRIIDDLLARQGHFPEALITTSYVLLQGMFDALLEHPTQRPPLRLATFGDTQLLDFLPLPVNAMGQQHKLIAETALNLALAAIEEQNYVPGIHAIARNFKQRIHQA